MILQSIRMALASIRQHKLRAFLTVLGIVIGVSSVVSVIAVGNGLKNSIAEQVESFGTNLLQINPGRPFGDQQEGGQSSFNFAASLGASTLTERDVEIVRGTPNVGPVSPAMLISGVLSASGKQTTPFILAVEPSMYDVIKGNQRLRSGSFLNPTQPNGLVLGKTAAEKLFGSMDVVGKTLTFRQQSWTVIGVLESVKETGLSFGPNFEDAAYLPFAAAKQLAGGIANIIEIDLLLTDSQQIETTKKAIEDAIKSAHGGELDFTVSTPDEQLKILDQILNAVTGFIAAIAGISLLVGGIGIMNIMLVSVTERTREIGIRKAIGAARWHILTQFLTEAVLLSLVGGALGMALAFGQGLLVKRAIDISPQFTLFAFIVAVGTSTFIGIVFGIAPAIKAARKNPVEALRYE